MKQSSKVNEIKLLFESSCLDECIKQVDEVSKENIDFIEYQQIQLYKGLSYFELSLTNEGNELMDRLIEQSQNKKGNKVDQIDVIIYTLYLWQVFDRKEQIAEQKNHELFETINSYKDQNENLNVYNKGIYLFGLSMYEFIESFRDKWNLRCIEILKQSLELVQNYEQEILNLVGWMYDNKQQQVESKEWSKKLFDLNPKYPGIANNLALIYKQNGEFDEALECFKFAEGISPENTIILSNIGMFYDDQQQFDMALSYYKKSYEINPKSGVSCYKYGKFLCQHNEKEEGIKILLKGIENDQECGIIYHELHIQELENHNYDKSTEYLQKCINTNPNNGYYVYKMGEHLLDMHQYEESIKFLKDCLKLKLYEVICYQANFNLGSCYMGLQEYELALEQFLLTYNLDEENERFMNEVYYICNILNTVKQVSQQKKIEIINNLFGDIQMRLSPIIQKQEHKDVQNALMIKQDSFREVLTSLVYESLVRPQLIFQNELSHWDLYID